MAPVWWFTSDPTSVYTASVGVNIAIAVATIWLLALMGRRLLTTPQALVAASVVMLLPSRTALVDYSLSE